MTNQMKRLLEDPQVTQTVARVWSVIEPVLLEQQRIMVLNDSVQCTTEELRGFTKAYRTLEKFKENGERMKEENSNTKTEH